LVVGSDGSGVRSTDPRAPPSGPGYDERGCDRCSGQIGTFACVAVRNVDGLDLEAGVDSGDSMDAPTHTGLTAMETVTLWRPTGPEELALVEASG
jgi:hypothetical protein